jgi:peptide alpha-N-acetyltransferase
MASIRQATAEDLIAMQASNLWCLPENYHLKYYMYHLLAWPQLLHVAVNHRGIINSFNYIIIIIIINYHYYY